MIENLRKKYGLRYLNSKLKEIVRYKEYNNFRTARTAGVIFSATKQDAFDQAKSFITELRNMGIKTKGMGYALTMEAASFFNHEQDIDVFSVGNVNWYYKPNNPLTDAFCQEEFDILIDLNLGHSLPLDFIVGLSKAKLKIGNSDSDNPYYDLIIDTKDRTSLENYLKQIKHYLNSMQRRK